MKFSPILLAFSFDPILAEICDERICTICNYVINSHDPLKMPENAKMKCSMVSSCCAAFFPPEQIDEEMIARIQAQMKQYIVVGVVGSLFGFAICGAIVLMIKYLMDKHRDSSNLNAMRRQSRARSISDETKDRRKLTIGTLSSIDSYSNQRSHASIITN